MNSLFKDTKTLIERVALFNDETAYKELFELYFPGLKRFAFCLVKSNEMAEEIASDAMINIWRNRSKLIEIKNPRLYLLVCVRNISLNYLKKNSRKKIVSLDAIDPGISFGITVDTEASYITSEMKRKLEIAVQALQQALPLLAIQQRCSL